MRASGDDVFVRTLRKITHKEWSRPRERPACAAGFWQVHCSNNRLFLRCDIAGLGIDEQPDLCCRSRGVTHGHVIVRACRDLGREFMSRGLGGGYEERSLDGSANDVASDAGKGSVHVRLSEYDSSHTNRQNGYVEVPCKNLVASTKKSMPSEEFVVMAYPRAYGHKWLHCIKA